MKATFLCVALLCVLPIARPLVGQADAQPVDTARSFFFRFAFAFRAPEVVRRSVELSLTTHQGDAVARAVRDAAAATRPLQQELRARQAALDALLQAATVDHAAVLAALDRVLAVESELKRLQMRLVLDTYGTLTPAQRVRVLRSARSVPD